MLMKTTEGDDWFPSFEGRMKKKEDCATQLDEAAAERWTVGSNVLKGARGASWSSLPHLNSTNLSKNTIVSMGGKRSIHKPSPATSPLCTKLIKKKGDVCIFTHDCLHRGGGPSMR